jgi:hypothetical protein
MRRALHVVAGEHRKHAVADQFEYVAAGRVNRIDRGLCIIVEKRNDLAGFNALADRGRAAQVGEPQHRIDPFGDTARDTAAQHLLGSIAPEIDPGRACA